MTAHPTRPDTLPRLELRVRSLAPDGALDEQRAIIDRLDRLEADGTIEGYDVQIWGKQFCPSTASGTEFGRRVRERLVELDEWAARSGLSVAPFFKTRTDRSGMADNTLAPIVNPVAVLAEYAGPVLRHVSPCTDGDSVYTVDDHLDALERDEERVPDDPDSRRSSVPAIMPAVQDAERDEAHGDSERDEDLGR